MKSGVCDLVLPLQVTLVLCVHGLVLFAVLEHMHWSSCAFPLCLCGFFIYFWGASGFRIECISFTCVLRIISAGMGARCHSWKGSTRWRWRGPSCRINIFPKCIAKGGKNDNQLLEQFLSPHSALIYLFIFLVMNLIILRCGKCVPFCTELLQLFTKYVYPVRQSHIIVFVFF